MSELVIFEPATGYASVIPADDESCRSSPRMRHFSCPFVDTGRGSEKCDHPGDLAATPPEKRPASSQGLGYKATFSVSNIVRPTPETAPSEKHRHPTCWHTPIPPGAGSLTPDPTPTFSCHQRTALERSANRIGGSAFPTGSESKGTDDMGPALLTSDGTASPLMPAPSRSHPEHLRMKRCNCCRRILKGTVSQRSGLCGLCDPQAKGPLTKRASEVQL